VSITAWLLLAGVLLLPTSLVGGWMRRTPLTPFALYAAAGVLIGPWVANAASIDLVEHARFVERVAEAALVVSLFIGGLKLRVLWHGAPWQAALRLAVPAMVLTIALTAAVAHYLLGASWPMALVLGAAVAPTDPVLASLVSVGDAADDDALRVTLSGEAGINDGAALPLLLLGLALMHTAPGDMKLLSHWLLPDVVWAIPAGVLIGYGLGRLLGSMAVRLRAMSQDTAPSDLLALSLLVLTYAIAQYLHASAFLAAFAAGLGLRHTEWRIVSRHPSPQAPEQPIHPPAEVLVNPHRREPEQVAEPATSIGLVVSDALTLGDTLERIIAACLIVLLGVAFATYFSVEGLVLAFILFFVIRPLSVFVSTTQCGLPRARRVILGWLGIRGIGSLYYVVYAATHGLDRAAATQLAQWVVTLVVVSVTLHGMSTQPIMAWRAARIARRAKTHRRE